MKFLWLQKQAANAKKASGTIAFDCAIVPFPTARSRKRMLMRVSKGQKLSKLLLLGRQVLCNPDALKPVSGREAAGHGRASSGLHMGARGRLCANCVCGEGGG